MILSIGSVVFKTMCDRDHAENKETTVMEHDTKRILQSLRSPKEYHDSEAC